MSLVLVWFGGFGELRSVQFCSGEAGRSSCGLVGQGPAGCGVLRLGGQVPVGRGVVWSGLAV